MLRCPELHRSIENLLNAYRGIGEQHMQELPIFNRRLEVEAVGFTQWEGRLLGVLITPWFMNLILLPGDQDDWSQVASGTSASWELPAGKYAFTMNPDKAIGVHQSLALFTTVTDFPDQQTARAVAQEIMDRILTNEGHQKIKPLESVAELPTRVLERPVSRRDLLRRFIPAEK